MHELSRGPEWWAGWLAAKLTDRKARESHERELPCDASDVRPADLGERVQECMRLMLIKQE
jgi:hypothetical protein